MRFNCKFLISQFKIDLKLILLIPDSDDEDNDKGVEEGSKNLS